MRILLFPIPCASNQCTSALRIVPSKRRTVALPSVSFPQNGQDSNLGADRNGFNVGNLTDNLEVHPSDTMANIGIESKRLACRSVGHP